MMWFFGRHGKSTTSKREAEVRAINSEIIQKVDNVTKKAKKLNTRLDQDGGVTWRIYLATGGDKRMRP